jgi:2-methylisocitrate lyase-like PEP mutase family enzyme
MSHAGVSKDETLAFLRAAEQGQDVARLITVKQVQELGVVGDIETCTRRIQEIINAGASTPVLFPVPGTNVIETVKTVAKKIVPSLA